MIRNLVKQAFTDVLKEDVSILTPKHTQFGDFAVNVMQMSTKPSQDDIAHFVKALESNPVIDKAEAQGAFINIFVSNSALEEELHTAVKAGDSYGSSDEGKKLTWEIEHTSPNPNKAMHLGHLRNNVVGMALSNIWEFLGINVIREEINNNRGIAIARLMWGYIKYGHPTAQDKDVNYWFDHQDEWDTPESRNIEPGKFVDELYVKASADFKDSPDVQQDVRDMVVAWENEDEKIWALWEKVLSYSYQGQENVLKRLGNKWDIVWNEHEHYKEGKEFVEKGLKEGIFVRTEEGTVITQLEKEYNIPDTVLLKSDGTSLYITQDIALTDLKVRKNNADIMFWIVGPEQSLAMKQMFAVCEQLGIAKLDQMIHIPYGFMSIKGQGSMSSRKGNVIYIDDLLDAAADKAKSLIKDSDNLSEDIDTVAEKVGVGAVKYSLLRVSRNQGTAFDIEESVSFEGNSGPYMQYAYARMRSLLRKAEIQESSLPAATIPPSLDTAEHDLLRKLPRFEEVVHEAGFSYAPHVIATYLFDLSQTFNAFYEESSILEADEDQKVFRLALTSATSHVIKNGLRLLGIDVVDRM